MAKHEGNVDLLAIEKLHGMKFRIPSYQRGYRWRKTHVKILLEDLAMFKKEVDASTSPTSVYSLQPLVVRKMVPGTWKHQLLEGLNKADSIENAEEIFNRYLEWEVIDGQQRLTTLFLLLTYLGADEVYSIAYDTRETSQEFLERLAKSDQSIEEDSKKNIDFCRMYEVYREIMTWFYDKDEDYKKSFLTLINERVQFIWYESVGEKPIEVFTRLNIGNIKLTDAELIKALILDRASFLDVHGECYRDKAQLKLARGKISSEWDEIECRLQDDAFWLYLQPWDDKAKKLPTRIDFLLQLATEIIPNMEKSDDDDVNDDHRLFHLYEKYFRSHRSDPQDRVSAREKIWASILDMYHVLEEWFEDSKLYHYTGYLMAVENKVVVGDLLREWYKQECDRELFVGVLQKRIRCSLKTIKEWAGKQSTPSAVKTLLDVVYEKKDEEGKVVGPPKAICRPLLLLYNVLTVVQLGEFMSEKQEYRGQRVFYKFPFNLYKREKWDIEHVASQTDNTMDKFEDQRDWLLSVYPFVSDELKEKIDVFCDPDQPQENKEEFSDLRESCENSCDVEPLRGDAKNIIWNFVLLDDETNRGYGNSLFPAKRRIIMFKEQGLKLENLRISSKDGGSQIVWDEKPASSPFVPPCTKHVFLQYYSGAKVSPLAWSMTDAQSYYDNMKKVLADFLKDSED